MRPLILPLIGVAIIALAIWLVTLIPTLILAWVGGIAIVGVVAAALVVGVLAFFSAAMAS